MLLMRLFLAALWPLAVFCGALSGAWAAEPDAEACAICMEAASGRVLEAQNADVQRPPASMVKLMLMLLVAEGEARGDWTFETKITASRHAQAMGGSQVWLAAGDVFALGHLMRAVAVGSANDAAMAVAEGLWGSEAAYLAAANARAKALGMTRTEVHSVHGLPPSKGEKTDLTTVRDMAVLARQCVRYPRILDWVGRKEFEFRPGQSILYNTNKLLWRMEGCDGLKTGYTRVAKFCVAATAERNGVRLIAVVMGHPSKYGRFNLAQRMLEEGFALALRGPSAHPTRLLRQQRPEEPPQPELKPEQSPL